MKERLIRHEKKLQIAWLCVIFFLFIVTRLWQLTSLPLGIHIDEAGMSYDAWCLAQWGVDRHLKSWPVYMMNFSMGQSSLYAFVCIVYTNRRIQPVDNTVACDVVFGSDTCVWNENCKEHL